MDVDNTPVNPGEFNAVMQELASQPTPHRVHRLEAERWIVGGIRSGGE
ncbi:MAG: hypothetical protein OEU94_10560 [Aquincola sp.]|nr:hypothetical protein [Aquincola sp.]MDH5331081.1 hypothetical protein [Aquincola sp.]